MGMVGTGKSTQGKLLATKGFKWISTGEMVRKLIKDERLKEVKAGKLLKDEEMYEMMDKTIKKLDKNQEFILDGFPRTMPQTQWLIEQVNKGRTHITAVFNLRLSKRAAKKRLLARGRMDDSAGAIKQRMKLYKSDTKPILKQLKKHGVAVYAINANQTPEQVHQDILKKLAFNLK